jgi:aryl-alcohol dehydrogenase-like predicted oxidoreductase
MAGRLEPVAERHGVPVAAVAVAWVLATSGVTGAIVGARRPSQVDGWLPAGNLRLSEADLAELA